MQNSPKLMSKEKKENSLASWKIYKQNNKFIKLHMIGKLQTNKVKKAIQIFDYIHSLDNIKLADQLNKYENDLNKKLSKDLVDAIGTIDKFINQMENKEVNEDSSQDLVEMFTKFKDELTLIVDLKESEEE